MTTEHSKGFLTLAITPHVIATAVKISLLVGTILALINHGDKLIAMALSGTDCLKILLTYLVPYCVSTWSAVRAIQANETESS